MMVYTAEDLARAARHRRWRTTLVALGVLVAAALGGRFLAGPFVWFAAGVGFVAFFFLLDAWVLGRRGPRRIG